MAALNEFSGIFIETSEFHINTLTGHFSRVLPGASIAESLQLFINNNTHSSQKRYYGALSLLQCAILTAISQHESSEKLTLTELSNIVYDADHTPQNPENAIRRAIARMEEELNVNPVEIAPVALQGGPNLRVFDKRVIRVENNIVSLAPAGYSDYS